MIKYLDFLPGYKTPIVLAAWLLVVAAYLGGVLDIDTANSIIGILMPLMGGTLALRLRRLILAK